MVNGKIIEKQADGSLKVPESPEIPFIEGDGIGPDIWRKDRFPGWRFLPVKKDLRKPVTGFQMKPWKKLKITRWRLRVP
jgi:isocitrate dehydrogenase